MGWFFDSWQESLEKGKALLATDPVAAEAKLRKALEGAPPSARGDVRFVLALALEHQGRATERDTELRLGQSEGSAACAEWMRDIDRRASAPAPRGSLPWGEIARAAGKIALGGVLGSMLDFGGADVDVPEDG